jgi:hypothetical protein
VDRFELSIFEQALTGGGLLAAVNQVGLALFTLFCRQNTNS